jgi:cytidine deaminase
MGRNSWYRIPFLTRTEKGERFAPYRVNVFDFRVSERIMHSMFESPIIHRSSICVLAIEFCLIACTVGIAKTKIEAHTSMLNREVLAQLLSEFSPAARQRLQSVLLDTNFDGEIEARVVKETLQLDGGRKTIEQFMSNMLPIAKLFAMPATSGFKVGAICQGISGNLYFGANLELANQPLGFTIHAEQSAIWNALAHQEKAVKSLAVTNAPCGHCRQFLNELTTASAFEVLVTGKPKTTLTALLPDSFGPTDLGVRGALFSQTEIPLVATTGKQDALAQAAFKAASRSYSPYTLSYSGVAIRLKDGTVVAGSYVECAAYNPSLPPMVAAIDRLSFMGYQFSDVSEVVLVELAEAKISQEGISRLILSNIGSNIEFRSVKARIEKM